MQIAARTGLLTALLFFTSFSFAAQWTIGVLALRGDAPTRHYWEPLTEQLNRALPGEHFTLLPLTLDQMREALHNNEIQFVLTNPAQFIQLDSNFPLRWLVSLRSAYEPDNATRNVIGSVLLVRKESAYQTPADLTGKKVGAVAPDAFGGYLLGYKALRDAGIDPPRDYHLQFSGFPADALLYLLRDKAISGAIVPACLIESMDKEGLIHQDDFRPLLGRDSTIPCWTSSKLYPNWSFAAGSGVPDELADEVTRVLLNSHGEKTMRWGAPSSTRQVENLLREVNQHPQQRQFWQEIISWSRKNSWLLGSVALVFLLLCINHVWIAFRVRRRTRQLEAAYSQLQRQQQDLEKAQQLSVLGEMASGFAHELNQPLSAIRHYAQGSQIRLEREDPAHPLLPVMSQIDSQAERGASIIRNLRLWAGNSPSSPEGAPVPQNVSAVPDLVWKLLRVTERYPSAVLYNTVAHDAVLHLPPALLDQVLSNLFSNSLQAGADCIRVMHHHTPGGQILVVQDNGGGMDETQLTQPFAPFRSTRSEGLGLGLVICQRLMRSQGGDIHMENCSGPDEQPGLCVTLIFSEPTKESPCP